MTTRIGITGVAGRMGRTLIEAIGVAGNELELTGAIEQPQSSLLGADSGELSLGDWPHLDEYAIDDSVGCK